MKNNSIDPLRVNKLKKILEEIKSEINPAELIAVSKYSSSDDIRFCHLAGQNDFGENKVQDLEQKAFELSDCLNINWHFIGYLQSNKVKKLLSVDNLVAIHSIHSIKLLRELKKNESILDHEIGIFFQVNFTGENEKSGFEKKEEILEAVNLFNTLDFKMIKLLGFMGMGPIRSTDFEADTKAVFEKISKLKNHGFKLSLGMSSDYKIAIANGSDYVRIGSRIFKT